MKIRMIGGPNHLTPYKRSDGTETLRVWIEGIEYEFDVHPYREGYVTFWDDRRKR